MDRPNHTARRRSSRVVQAVVIVFALCPAARAEPSADETKANQAGLLRAEFIYETAPFPKCHASTIAETPAGTLVAAWFGGTNEGSRDVGVWFARRTDEGWTAPVEVANGLQDDGTRYPCWNPVLFQPNEGPLLLFYKVGPSPQRWWGMLIASADGGQTWSRPRRLPDGILGPIKNKPVLLAGGDLLCPTSTETPQRPSMWRVHFERVALSELVSWAKMRDDEVEPGRIWTKSEPSSPGEPPIDAIQPSILVHPGGKLQAVGRTRSQRLFEAWSDDAGNTWDQVGLTELPNPNSGTDAVTLADGRHLLVYNHTSRSRSPLNVALSPDGRAWQAALVLEKESGEYSYPAVIQTADGLVHVTYTWKRQKIKHAVVDPRKLVPRDLPEGR